jgi:hypothetical protein
VRANITQVAVCREDSPFLCSRVFQTVFSVISVIETAHGLAILLDELTGVELGVDHHGVGRGVTEQRLNNVHGRVVVQMFGCEDAPAIAGQQHESRAIRAAGFRSDRDLADAGPNGLNASGAGMANALDQVRRWRARTLFQQVPMIANRDRLAVVEAFYVSDDLS